MSKPRVVFTGDEILRALEAQFHERFKAAGFTNHDDCTIRAERAAGGIIVIEGPEKR